MKTLYDYTTTIVAIVGLALIIILATGCGGGGGGSSSVDPGPNPKDWDVSAVTAINPPGIRFAAKLKGISNDSEGWNSSVEGVMKYQTSNDPIYTDIGVVYPRSIARNIMTNDGSAYVEDLWFTDEQGFLRFYVYENSYLGVIFYCNAKTTGDPLPEHAITHVGDEGMVAVMECETDDGYAMGDLSIKYEVRAVNDSIIIWFTLTLAEKDGNYGLSHIGFVVDGNGKISSYQEEATVGLMAVNGFGEPWPYEIFVDVHSVSN